MSRQRDRSGPLTGTRMEFMENIRHQGTTVLHIVCAVTGCA